MNEQHPQAPSPGPEDLLLLPLGGSGEIGMNMTLYGHDDRWIMVDAGITFGAEAFPDYEVMMADPAFIADRRDRLAGIVLTHGHEDHIGALPHLWQRLQCPIYATPFTAMLVRQKLQRAGIHDAPLIEIALDATFDLGPFRIEYIGMTHSIPEPNALLITTAAGTVLHTGDWKLDPDPVVGRSYDRARLRRLRNIDDLAMVCDSTNAVVAGHTGSESGLFKPLCEQVEQAGGRVIVTSFASNVARLLTLARVAQATGRRFGVIGPAMERMVSLARGAGYWPDDLPELVDARHLGYLPPEEVLAACTGSQGERRAAVAKLASDRHRDLTLDPGDTVIFSSRLIPGNERALSALEAQLRQIGVGIVTDRDAEVHVSGHPAAEDLRRIYEWVQPGCMIPVHGTPRHLQANIEIARSCGIGRTLTVLNGACCHLGVSPVSDGAGFSGEVENGRLHPGRDGLLQSVPAQVLAQMRVQAD